MFHRIWYIKYEILTTWIFSGFFIVLYPYRESEECRIVLINVEKVPDSKKRVPEKCRISAGSSGRNPPED